MLTLYPRTKDAYLYFTVLVSGVIALVWIRSQVTHMDLGFYFPCPVISSPSTLSLLTENIVQYRPFFTVSRLAFFVRIQDVLVCSFCCCDFRL
jgi:hypothetical protein